MPIVHFVESGLSVTVAAGTSIMDAAAGAGVEMESPCNRTGVCGKCRVRLSPESLANVSVPGDSRLSEELRADGQVLACETFVHGDIEVQPFKHATGEAMRVLEFGIAAQGELAPAISKVHSPERGVTMVMAGGLQLEVEEGDTSQAAFGIVVDIGTTSLVTCLVDLLTGRELACVSRLNPQAKLAQDVLSRISYAKGEEGLTGMWNLVSRAIDEMILEVVKQAGTDAANIYEVIYCGNTCMLHLGAGVNPASLGKYPYTPVIWGNQYFTAGDVGLASVPRARVYFPPIISTYVGADITAGILGLRLFDLPGVCLMVDIGTNGEMALSCNGRLRATSTAAGPAFEGMNISCGMRAGLGAVERVALGEDGGVTISVIGGEQGAKPCGLCGSGLLDLSSELVRTGLVLKNGRFADPAENGINPLLAKRLQRRDGYPAFEVAPGVYLTQKDIRQVQLAKGAVRSGIDIMLQDSKISPDEVDRVLIAGAFGYHLAPDSLITLGLLPSAFAGKIEFVGNTSKTGGHMLLTHEPSRDALTALMADVEVLELADYENFDRMFAKSMGF